jgi:hypothetical protein
MPHRKGIPAHRHPKPIDHMTDTSGSPYETFFNTARNETDLICISKTECPLRGNIQPSKMIFTFKCIPIVCCHRLLACWHILSRLPQDFTGRHDLSPDRTATIPLDGRPFEEKE